MELVHTPTEAANALSRLCRACKTRAQGAPVGHTAVHLTVQLFHFLRFVCRIWSLAGPGLAMTSLLVAASRRRKEREKVEDVHVDHERPCCFPTGGGPWPRGARLAPGGSFEPGDQTGLRLSPHLAPSTSLRPATCHRPWPCDRLDRTAPLAMRWTEDDTDKLATRTRPRVGQHLALAASAIAPSLPPAACAVVSRRTGARRRVFRAVGYQGHARLSAEYRPPHMRQVHTHTCATHAGSGAHTYLILRRRARLASQTPDTRTSS